MPGVDGDVAAALRSLGGRASVYADLDELVAALSESAQEGDRIVVMSNGGFGAVHDPLLGHLAARS